MASPASSFRGVPPAASTRNRKLSLVRDEGLFASSVVNAIVFPSGDHAGSNPCSVTRRTDSPVAPARKTPPSWSDS